jgi:hypothetical protein
VASRNRRLQSVRAELSRQRLGPIQRGEATRDVHRIPLRAILIKQQDRRPVIGDAGR